MENEYIKASLTVGSTYLSVKFPELAVPLALTTALTDLGSVLSVKPAWDKAREAQKQVIIDVTEQLACKGTKHELTTHQFDFITDLIRTVTQTIDETKLDYLKNSLVNVVSTDDNAFDAVLVRIVRDITAHEMCFVYNHRRYSELQELNSRTSEEQIAELITSSDNDLLYIQETRYPGLVSGLLSLGIIKDLNYMDGGRYCFTSLRDQLCLLVQPPE